MHDELLEVAKQLLTLDGGKLKQAVLRRVISTAYYALFHALCDACVTCLIGSRRKSKAWPLASPLYRSIDHGVAKRVCSQVRSRSSASQDVRRLAEAFLTLQEARLRADYDPDVRFVRADAVQRIDDAEDALIQLRNLSADARLEFVVQLIAKQR